MDKETVSAEKVKAWQQRTGFTYEKAADKLGVGHATFARYLTDGAGRTVALALLALEGRLLYKSFPSEAW